jgi:uncharacterized membrane protein YeaQ/YmgE (transglycosylase-associated protein family)
LTSLATPDRPDQYTSEDEVIVLDFVIAVVIGLVVGGIGGYLLRGRHPNALWLAPVLSVLGAVIASILATVFGTPGYGWKEALLQVVLALAGAGVVAMLGSRRPSAAA